MKIKGICSVRSWGSVLGLLAMSQAGVLQGLSSASPKNATSGEARESAIRKLADAGGAEIVFAVRQPGSADRTDGHWYANFGYYADDANRMVCRSGEGKLCRLDLKTGQLTILLDARHGSIRDPQVHYDGRKILFSYLREGGSHYHLYEIQSDGTDLRQLTSGERDDVEPTYLPDGGIVFVSTRCNRWVNCWLTQVGVLHRCDADGGNIRPVSSNIEHDNTPWVLPNGQILYLRWEYVDRSQVDYHALWIANPDGTQQTVYYGNMHPGIAMLDAKPIPGTRKVAAIFSPGHGRLEHQGQVAIVDPRSGPDAKEAVEVIPGPPDYRDPWPIDEHTVLAARRADLQVLDRQGNATTLFRLPAAWREAGLWLHEPRVLAARPREPLIPSRIDETKATGRLVLADVYEGRNLKGVRRGDIKKLLVLETLAKPINYTGGMEPLSYGGTFTLERIVGTVPVEPDGSAYFDLPALRSFFFVALDEHDLSVKRMHSFTSLQPGEVSSCVGCHEHRTHSVLPLNNLAAMKRPPSRVAPVPDIPEVIDFPRDIQPILNRHCVGCHGYERPRPAGEAGEEDGPYAGGIVLTGDRGPMYSHSYYFLTIAGQLADGRNEPRGSRGPRSVGAVASPLMKKVREGHHGVALGDHELNLIRYWLETGAPYPGTYAALGSGMIGGYRQNRQTDTDWHWPEAKAVDEVVGRRCASCHTGPRVLPRSLSDERGVSFWRPAWDDPRLWLSRHLVFNLTRPEKSLVLLAPLATSSGGFGICRTPPDGRRAGPVFADERDPDYQMLLALCRAGKRDLERRGRFDMDGFRPPEPYLREMVRFGVIPRIPSAQEPVDPYGMDEAYWRSLWFKPVPLVSSAP